MTDLVEDFDGPGLDTSVWLPHYLPMWSSRAGAARLSRQIMVAVVDFPDWTRGDDDDLVPELVVDRITTTD